MTVRIITKQEIKNLRLRIGVFAVRNSVGSVRALADCDRALIAASVRRADARAPWILRALTHFQFLKAAAAEKATRRG